MKNITVRTVQHAEDILFGGMPAINQELAFELFKMLEPFLEYKTLDDDMFEITLSVYVTENKKETL